MWANPRLLNERTEPSQRAAQDEAPGGYDETLGPALFLPSDEQGQRVHEAGV